MWVNIVKETTGEYSIMIYIKNFLDDKELEECNLWLNDKYEKGLFHNAMNNIRSNENCCGLKLKEKDLIRSTVRKQLWFQKDKQYFCKIWKERYKRWESEEYDDFIIKLQKIISLRLQEYNRINKWTLNLDEIKKDNNLEKIDNEFNFNSCLLNLYETGNEGISPHRDSIYSFGLYPTVVGLSIGETRVMRIKRIYYNENNISSLKQDNKKCGLSMDIPLENNSVFIMMGCSQKYYTHEIIKDKNIKNKRFSFTFRKWVG